MPLNNEIITIDDELEGLDIISFLKFDDMYAEIKNEVSLKNSTYNKENVYVIKSYKKKNKKKSCEIFYK